MKNLTLTFAVILMFMPGLSTPALAGPDSVLAYDDGTFEIYSMIHKSQYLRQRFLVSDFGLSGHYLIETVRINWGSSSKDFAGEIKLRDYDTGEAVTAVSFTRPASGWHDYDISGLGFVSEQFYVELWQTAGFGYLCADTDAPHHVMSEVSTNYGANWHVPAIETDFMVRVSVVPSLKASNPRPADGAMHGYSWANLSWTPGNTAVSQDVYFGENFDDVNNGTGGTFQGNQTETSFTVGLAGFPYPDDFVPGATYYWRVDEVEADGTTVHKGDVWSFTYAIEVVEDFETGDFSKLPWEHYGDETWTWDITSRQKHSGAHSAKSGAIYHDQSTSLQVTLDCVSGNITFYRKVSSELNCDHLKFYIDGVEKGRWSGEEDWVQVSFAVTGGTRTFKWTYIKDGSEIEGEDTVWIDDVRIYKKAPSAEESE